MVVKEIVPPHHISCNKNSPNVIIEAVIPVDICSLMIVRSCTDCVFTVKYIVYICTLAC